MGMVLDKEPHAGAPAPETLMWLLAQTSHVLNTEMTAAMADLGLSPRDLCVLMTAADGEFTQRQIADAVGLDKTTMVVTLDSLEAQGLAERRPSPTDRRARMIAVTAAGRKMIARGREIQVGIQEEILDGLPAAQRDGLTKGLQTLALGRLSTPAACKGAPRRRT